MAEALAGHPFQGQDDTELKRLKRLLPALEREGGNCDLAEAVRTILAYEAATSHPTRQRATMTAAGQRARKPACASSLSQTAWSTSCR